MFDYWIAYFVLISLLKKLGIWTTKHRVELATHIQNLGIAGYTGSYVYLIQTGVDIKTFALLFSGIAFTVFAKKMKGK